MSAPTEEREGALPRKRGRSVPALYGVVSLVLVAGALTFALSSPPPSTPPLAEVAPAPQDQIEVERVEQSSRFGEGQGGEGDECVVGDAGCEGASGQALAGEDADRGGEVVETSAPGELRNCRNRGLTQTDDPQSPPCKREIFRGDNGEATWTGVTATTIRVAVPHGGSGDQDDAQVVLPPLVEHVNSEYELYGRTLELVPVDMPEGERNDPAYQRALAREVAAHDVFVSLEQPGRPGTYERTLAQDGVVSVIGDYGGRASEELATELHPHLWQAYPSLEEIHRVTGGFVCEQLSGRPARHGGDEVRESARRFGVLHDDTTAAGRVAVGILESRLAACGVEAPRYEYRSGDTDLEALLTRMRGDGVTTVVCSCGSLEERYLDGAEEIGYRPEWFLAGIDHKAVRMRERSTNSGDKYPREQIAHVFGLSAHLRKPSQDLAMGAARYGEQYWFHAVRDADPAWQPEDDFWAEHHYGYYAQLLILASGIQWAGPELTPTTFGDALTELTFPNPGVGEAPWFQPSVGFGPGDHSFNSDYALLWWRDPDDAAYESRTDFGEMCYVGGGARFTADTMPPGADDLFFDPEEGCR